MTFPNSELIFFIRSWLNVAIVGLAGMRRRSASWMLEALGVVASMIAIILIAFGIVIYWLVNKWSGR